MGSNRRSVVMRSNRACVVMRSNRACVVMRSLWLVFALAWGCGDSDAPDFRRLDPTDPSQFPCEPACAPSYACDDGQCVPACEPDCPAGTTCQLDGSCLASLDAGPGEDFERNSCGGFGSLEGVPGTTCGPCGTGHWLCETENVVVCADPVGRNACGFCGELPGEPGVQCDDEKRWACTPDGDLQCMPWFDANACLGTVDLGDAVPGRPCGACNEGYYVCDGLNATVCEIPELAPSECDCTVGVSPPVACGTAAGVCERGVRFCGPDGRYGACVASALGASCTSDAECGEGVCIPELVDPNESITDACTALGDAACQRRVCRVPELSYGCETDADCRPGSACALGACSRMVYRPTPERCNGVDDDCNGLIDDDDRRTEICGSCPFNMMLVVNAEREFGRIRLCIDIFEAARPDATDVSAGVDESRAVSRAGLIPWTGLTAEEAVAACAAEGYNAAIPGGVAERRLCVVDEWPLACNLEGCDYPYGGEDFMPGACHDASSGSTSAAPTASFAGCGYTVPGGSFPNWDFSGNVAEWIRGEGGTWVAGGSFLDTGDALSCGAVEPGPAAGAPNVGFRCCAGAISTTDGPGL